MENTFVAEVAYWVHWSCDDIDRRSSGDGCVVLTVAVIAMLALLLFNSETSESEQCAWRDVDIRAGSHGLLPCRLAFPRR